MIEVITNIYFIATAIFLIGIATKSFDASQDGGSTKYNILNDVSYTIPNGSEWVMLVLAFMPILNLLFAISFVARWFKNATKLK